MVLQMLSFGSCMVLLSITYDSTELLGENPARTPPNKNEAVTVGKPSSEPIVAGAMLEFNWTETGAPAVESEDLGLEGSALKNHGGKC